MERQNYEETRGKLLARLESYIRWDEPKWKIEELTVAIATETTPWADLSPEFKNERGLPTKDIGIDSANEKTAVQVKYRAKSTSVSWPEVAKFLAASALCKKPFETRLLFRGKGIKVPKHLIDSYDSYHLSDETRQKVLNRLPSAHAAIEKADDADSVADSVANADGVANAGAVANSVGVADGVANHVDCADVVANADSVGVTNAVANHVDTDVNAVAAADHATSDIDHVDDNDSALADATDNSINDVNDGTDGMDGVDEDGIKFALRECQRDAYDVIENSPQTEVSVSMPCGSGKTQIIIEYIRSHPTESVIVFVPTIVLMEQISSMFFDNGIDSTKIGTGYNDGRAVGNLGKEEMEKAVVCVYNSAPHVLGIKFDAVFVDEAHHIKVPKVYKDIDVSSEAGKFTDDIVKIKQSAKKVVYMSATLDHADYKLGLRQAINEGWLNDYDICIPLYTRSITDECVAAFLLRYHEHRHVLLYSNSRARAASVAAALTTNGLKCGYIDGTTSKSERLRTLDKFKSGELRYLSTVNVLGEGIDLKIADTCMFVEPRNSSIAIIQCVGRILRLHKEKIMAHVIIPSCDDEEQSLQSFMRVIAKADTAVCKSILSQSCRVSSISGPTSIQPNSQEDTPDRDADQDTIECKLLGAALYTSLGDAINSLWDTKYQAVKDFISVHGRMPVCSDEWRGFGIGMWINRQRRAKKGTGSSKITPDRIELLEELPGWFWDLDGRWAKSYQLVKDFIEEKGHLPMVHETYKGEKIGWWIGTQRGAKKGTRGYKITPDRIELLESLPGWFWDLDGQWAKSYQLVKDFIEENGHLPAQLTIHKGEKIGWWIGRQRSAKKGTESRKITPDRIKLLEELPGWEWNPAIGRRKNG